MLIRCCVWLGLWLLAGPALAQLPKTRPLPPVPDSLKPLMQRTGTLAQRQRALQRVADAYANQDDTVGTLAYANAALQLAAQRHDPAGRGAALNAIASAYLSGGRLAAAVRVAQQALPLHTGRGWADSKMVLGMTYINMGRPAEALKVLREARQAYGTIPDLAAQLRIDIVQGTVYYSRNMLDSAEVCLLRTARAQHHLPGQHRDEASTLGNLAAIYTQRKNYAAATRYARQALALEQLDHDSTRFCGPLNTLTVAALGTNDPTLALHYARRALWIARHVHYFEGELAALSNMGTSHGRLQHLDSAQLYYTQGLALTQRGGSVTYRGDFLQRLATLYDDNQRPTEALRYAQQAEALDSVQRTPSVTVTNLRLLGKLARERHDDAAALGYFLRQRVREQRQAAAASSKEVSALRVQFDAERTEQQLALATARAATETQRAEAQTQQAIALRLLGQQHDATYRDTLSQRERQRLAQALRAEQEASRAERAGQQVLALTQRNRAQTQQARLQEQALRLASQQQELARLRSQRQLAGVGALGLLGVLLAGGLFWQYRRRQATARLTAAAALRTRLAADLHDDVGNLLTQISLQSGLLRESPLLPAPLLARVDALTSTARRATQQMSDAIWGLAATAPTLPDLLRHMRDHAHEVLQPLGIEPRFDTHPAVPALPLSAEARQALYLIFKEALHNIVKHAHPTEVVITLAPAHPGLALTVRNDGPAAAPVPARPEGQGLASMQARAAAVGGRVQYPAQPAGFVVEAVVG